MTEEPASDLTNSPRYNLRLRKRSKRRELLSSSNVTVTSCSRVQDTGRGNRGRRGGEDQEVEKIKR